MSCPVCGGDRRCHLTGGHVVDADFLSVEDWRKIYEFMREIQLPFMHRLITRAADRNGIDIKRWRKSRREIRQLEQEQREAKE